MEITWQVQTEQPISLRQFLLQQGVSRRLYFKLKVTGPSFKVNDEIAKPDLPLKTGDVVTVKLPAEESDEQVAVSDQPITVVYEDDLWLVVNKPAHLASIPGPTNRTDTLLNRVKGYWVANGATDLVPHLLTRLDFNTSGLVLIGKHQIAQGALQPQIEQHKMTKKYLAVILGQLEPANGEIKQPIGQMPDEIRRRVMVTGQMAITQYQTVVTTPTISALKLELITGRTHQIRVHLESLGHPILGDELYGGSTDLIERQALHAYFLSFYDPFGRQQREFYAPIPADIQALLPAPLALAEI